VTRPNRREAYPMASVIDPQVITQLR